MHPTRALGVLADLRGPRGSEALLLPQRRRRAGDPHGLLLLPPPADPVRAIPVRPPLLILIVQHFLRELIPLLGTNPSSRRLLLLLPPHRVRIVHAHHHLPPSHHRVGAVHA
ncbi:hypothetical protein JZU48_01680, partial [bacterium]|nr:hypothetical protein [bacterium]